MKRCKNSNSLASALLTMYSSKETKQSGENYGYQEEFQAMLDRLEQEDCCEEASFVLEKKRRLSYDQVKALERNFELDNKLESERKVKLAEELGLQPRQIAIWFQNRRARWKTKQLERDYGLLKSNFDALMLDFNNLEQENAALTVKLRELKAKKHGDSAECNQFHKEESPVSDLGSRKNNDQQILRDRAASQSNSNGVVKEESNVDSNESFPNSSSLINWFQHCDSKGSPDRAFHTQFMRMEDQNLFSISEFCNFFSVDQYPTL